MSPSRWVYYPNRTGLVYPMPYAPAQINILSPVCRDRRRGWHNAVVAVVYVKTFGCKVNQADSDALCRALRQQQIASAPLRSVNDLAAGQVVIVNTCCVTAEAERKALQFTRKLRREHPDVDVLLTGCSARNPAGNSDYISAGAVVLPWYLDAADWLAQHRPALAAQPAHGGDDPAYASGERWRAFVKVQDGCCNYCAYCIVPSVRQFASTPLPAVLEEVVRLVVKGKRELVLTGVNIGHYGMAPAWPPGLTAPEPAQYQAQDGQPQLCELIDAVLDRLPPDTRLRLSSIEPDTVGARLLEQFTHPQMCPHLHMPLQSGSNTVLAAMRRRYTVREYLALVERFRSALPGGAVTADVLTGYPAESEVDFKQTLAVCEQAGFERVHGFPYSSRPGTAASQLTPLPVGVVQRRNRELLEHCRGIADRAWRRYLGHTARVLVEKQTGARIGGHAPTYSGHGEAYQIVSAALPTDALATRLDLRGRIVAVRLESYTTQGFTGTLLGCE